MMHNFWKHDRHHALASFNMTIMLIFLFLIELITKCQASVVSIEFGGVNTRAAYIAPGTKVNLVLNNDGNSVTLSTVAIDGGKRFIGSSAINFVKII